MGGVGDAPPDTALAQRPLGIGELLDRTIALVVRWARLIVPVELVYALPIAVLAAFGVRAGPQYWHALGTIIAHPDARIITQFFALSRAVGKLVTQAPPWIAPVEWIFILTIGTLTRGAVIFAVEAAARNQPCRLRTAYGASMQRFVLLTLVRIVDAIAAIIAAVCIGLLIVIGAAALTALLAAIAPHPASGGPPVSPIILAVIVAFFIPVFAFVVVIMALGYLTWQMSFMPAMLEGEDAFRAFGIALSSVFARKHLRRSLLASLTIGAVWFGTGFVAVVGQGFLTVAGNSGAAGVAYSSIVGLARSLVIDVFVVLYYLDIRSRRRAANPLYASAVPVT